MKKILVLVEKISPKKKLFRKLISQRLGKNVQVILGKFSDIAIEIDGGSVSAFLQETNLKDFDLVYFRRIDHSIFPLSGTLAMCLDKLGVKYFDTKFREIGSGGDKVTSLVKLALAGIPVPKTLFITRGNIIKNGDKIIAKLGLPIIAKDTESQANKGIYYIKRKEDFKKLFELNKVRVGGIPIQFLFQEFIGIDQEFRLLVLGDKVAVTHTKAKRKYEDIVIGWKDMNEYPVFVNPDTVSTELKKIAVKAAKVLDIEIAGVDGCLVKGSGKAVIFEVNRGPGIDYDTKVSPEIDQISEFFKKEISNNE